MRFWLSAFVVLFVAVELLDWVAHVTSLHAHGVWLVLGGMGLAAASNSGRTHLLENEQESKRVSQSNVEKPKEDVQPPNKEKVDLGRGVDRSEDSVSFKVRPLKR